MKEKVEKQVAVAPTQLRQNQVHEVNEQFCKMFVNSV